MPSSRKLDEIPVVGECYRGSGIVTDIQETVQEITSRQQMWTHKVVTLNSGAVYTLDHYVDIPPSSQNGQSKKATLPSSSSSPSPPEMIVQEIKPPPPPPDVSETDDSASSSSSSLVPLTIMVYSKNDPDLLPASPGSVSEPGQIQGVWTFGDGRSTYDDNNDDDDDEGEEFWKPQEVLLFPPKRMMMTKPTLETIPEESSLPSGVWGYEEDQNQSDDSSNNNSSLPHRDTVTVEDWHPKGRALVVPPRVEIPENFVAAGRYTYKPDAAHKSWPPPMDHVRKQLHDVGKLQIPKCFEDHEGKFPIKVFPKSKLDIDTVAPIFPPKDRWDEVQEGRRSAESSPIMPRRKKAVSFAPPLGQWVYPEGKEIDDDHFLPVDVDLYWGDEKPPSVSGGMSSDDGSTSSWGLWGSSVGSIDLDDPEWEPEMSMVFPPGMEPDDPEIAIQGRWAYRMNQNVKIEWPPSKTRLATVYPNKDAPAIERGKSQGVWKFEHGRNEANDDNWEPMEVELLGQYDRVDNIEDDDSNNDKGPRIFGLWGIQHGAEPDKNWDWQPNDVVFFPPNQTAADDTWVQGQWVLKRQDAWPPRSKSKRKSRTVGKLKNVKWPSTAWVYPIQSAPPPKPGRMLGTWNFHGDLEPKDAPTWKPQQVDLHGPNVRMDDSKPNGIWGVNENARVLEQDSDSSFHPEDVWFYPPGKSPQKNCSVQGKWAFHTNKLGMTWPPPSQSPAGPGRKSSVGKLKIPGAFEKEASPRVGKKGSSHGEGKGQVPSMFSSS